MWLCDGFPVCLPECSDHLQPGEYSPLPTTTDSSTTTPRWLPSRKRRSFTLDSGFPVTMFAINHLNLAQPIPPSAQLHPFHSSMIERKSRIICFIPHLP